MGTNFALEGYRAANKRRYLWWVFAGFWLLPPLSLALPWLQRRLPAPEPPARVLEEGPTEAVAQQVFIAAYVRRAHARRRRKAWLGFAASFWLPAAVLIQSLVERPGDRQSDVGTQQAVERNVGAGGEEELRGTAAAVVAERRRYAEEARGREAEAREQLPVRIGEIEALYDAIAETHEAVARVLADEWEQRWARDRAATARSTKRRFVENLEATREFQGVEAAFGIAGAAYRDAELELADAREQLEQAQAAAAR